MVGVQTEELTSNVRALLQTYAQKWKVFIYAKGPTRDESALNPPNTKKGRLEIYFYSAPSVGSYSNGEEESYMGVFGKEFGGSQTYGVKTSLVGYPIKDDAGQVVAEVVENTLYIPFNLSQYEWYEEEQSLEILRLILDGYEKVPDIEERRKLEGKKRRELRSASFQNFQRFFSRTHHSASQIRKQYDYLLGLSKGDLIVTATEVRVNLGKMRYRESGTGTNKTNIGEILFILRPHEYESDFVKIFYLNPGYQRVHNHIYGEGDLCLGNIYGGVSKFLRSKEIARAAEAIKLFVEES